MDPDTCFAEMLDAFAGYDDSELVINQKANALYLWIADGGHLPSQLTGANRVAVINLLCCIMSVYRGEG